MFKVVPTNVDAPLDPVTVNVKAPCLPLKVVQSVELKYPFTEVVATGIEIVFVVLTKGLEKVSTFSFPLNVVQSVEDK